MIIKYLRKNPLSNIRNIADHHDKKKRNYDVIKKDVGKLVKEKSIFKFADTKSYYFTTDQKEWKMLDSIIKSDVILQPKFRRLKFDSEDWKPTFDKIIRECISLFHLKLKIRKIELRRKKEVNIFDNETEKIKRKYIKFLKSFVLPTENESKKQEFIYFSNHLWKEYEKDKAFFDELITNRKPVKKMIKILNKITDEDKKSVSLELGITNKAVDKSLDKYKNEDGVYLWEKLYILGEAEKDRESVNAPTNTEITRALFKSAGKRVLKDIPISRRKQAAKKLEEKFGINFFTIEGLFDT